jgi:DNA polymerase-3 subunit beta
MKIECIKDRLADAVGKAEKVAGRNPTLPILSGLHLQALKNTLTIRATNLDLGISISIPVKVIEPGEIVVPAHILNSFLNSLVKEKSIALNSKEQTLRVATNSTETSIKTLPVDDFPIIPEIKDDENLTLPSRDLVIGFKSVIYAAATGSMKPELSSICLAHEGDSIVFVATDSFRLAEKKIKIKKVTNFKQVLIPQKNTAEIVRIFDLVDDDISISIEENQIALRGGGIYLTSRIIDGVFPDYKQIIPKETTSKAIVLKQDLVNSLKTALIFSDSLNQLRLTLAPSKKLFEIESKNNNIGENVYAVEAAIEGADLTINVNHRYLTDCFQSIPADTINLSFSGQTKPIVVTGVGDKSFMYLTMPMNRS